MAAASGHDARELSSTMGAHGRSVSESTGLVGVRGRSTKNHLNSINGNLRGRPTCGAPSARHTTQCPIRRPLQLPSRTPARNRQRVIPPAVSSTGRNPHRESGAAMADAGCFPAPAKCVRPERTRVPAGHARTDGGRAPVAGRLRIRRLRKDTLPSRSETPAVAKASGGQAEFPVHVGGRARIA